MLFVLQTSHLFIIVYCYIIHCLSKTTWIGMSNKNRLLFAWILLLQIICTWWLKILLHFQYSLTNMKSNFDLKRKWKTIAAYPIKKQDFFWTFFSLLSSLLLSVMYLQISVKLDWCFSPKYFTLQNFICKIKATGIGITKFYLALKSNVVTLIKVVSVLHHHNMICQFWNVWFSNT